MPLSKLYVGLTLYEDVYNILGAFILSKGTVIDQHHIKRLMMNKVEKVKVLVEEKFKEEDTVIPKITSIYDKAKIKSFRLKYVQKVDEVTQVIKAIGKGSYLNLNLNEIHNISKNIMDEFDTLSDVVNYLNLAKSLDDYTYSHSLNVSLMAIVIGTWMGFDKKQIDEIAIAGLLHDIGKTKVSQELLSKPGKLTPVEFEEIKKHAILGFMMVEKAMNISADTKYAILMHHEKIDGTGYTTGATEKQIPLYVRIIAVADIYDAMTSNRTYRDKLCPFEVIFINPNRVWQPVVRSGDDFIDLSSISQSTNFIKQII